MTTPTGGGQSPFDLAAQSALGALSGARPPLSPLLTRPPLTLAERRDAADAIKAGGLCRFCGGIHVGASTPACPRLASGKLNGDGDIVEFAFWPTWDATRVVFPEDAEDEPEPEEG